MKFSELLKNHKIFVVCIIVVILFFVGFLTDNHIRLHEMETEYEEQIEELKELVQITNMGKTPEIEFDIYQTAEDFLSFYYSVSSEVTNEYRNNRLKEVMTEEAYEEYVTGDYENTLGYSVWLSDIQIFVDYKKSTREKVYACVFYNENTDWTNINTITIRKYWLGIFKYDTSKQDWKLSEIMDCQELLTREEFEAFSLDTDVSGFDYEKGTEETNEEKEEKEETISE